MPSLEHTYDDDETVEAAKIGGFFDYIRDHELIRSLIHTLKFVLPEPYFTRFNARRKVITDLVVNGFSSPLPPTDAVRACWYGFTQDLYTLYDLEHGGDPTIYLNEIERRHARLTNDHPELLDDKQRFYDYLRTHGFSAYLPTRYGSIENGSFISDRYDTVLSAIAEHGRVIIKRCTGGGGNNVYVGVLDSDGVQLGPQGRVTDDPDAKIRDFENHLVTEYCEQAEYLDRIYPDAANTMRILTLRSDKGDVLIPAAVHRFGSDRTGGLDNFSQGGLSAAINMETGELSMAAERVDRKGVHWHETHPTTGATIAGVVVPKWGQIKDQIRTIAAEMEAFSYVGWDLLVTSPGEFKIIEGNSYPDPDVMQVHEPLLTDDDVRQFLKEHGVIP